MDKPQQQKFPGIEGVKRCEKFSKSSVELSMMYKAFFTYIICIFFLIFTNLKVSAIWSITEAEFDSK